MCGILAAGGGLCFWVNHELTTTVWTTPVTEKLSPSRAWKALVDDTVYEPSWGGSVIISSVHLMPMRIGAKAVDILSVDGDEPRITWTDADVLQVTVPNLSYLTVKRREYEGVRIDLRFDPDDPAARAAWLKKQREPASPHPDR